MSRHKVALLYYLQYNENLGETVLTTYLLYIRLWLFWYEIYNVVNNITGINKRPSQLSSFWIYLQYCCSCPLFLSSVLILLYVTRIAIH